MKFKNPEEFIDRYKYIFGRLRPHEIDNPYEEDTFLENKEDLLESPLVQGLDENLVSLVDWLDIYNCLFGERFIRYDNCNYHSFEFTVSEFMTMTYYPFDDEYEKEELQVDWYSAPMVGKDILLNEDFVRSTCPIYCSSNVRYFDTKRDMRMFFGYTDITLPYPN